MGEVYRAVTREAVAGLEAGTVVALKVLHPHLLHEASMRERFRRESELGQRVTHPNVVRTYASLSYEYEGSERHLLVMEYVEGQTVRRLLQDLGRVPEELCRHIALEVAEGLCAIHAAGGVHRDLKPENLLITREHRVKVMDLGVAWFEDAAFRLTRSDAFVGTLLYTSPDALRADSSIDGRADLFSLGVVLHELVTGRHPFHDENPMTVFRRLLRDKPPRVSDTIPYVSTFFDALIDGLLCKEREDRVGPAMRLAGILRDGERSAWWRERARSARQATRRPLRRLRQIRETRIVGREADLVSLRSAFDRAREGEAQTVLIRGEAGVGKSCLLDAFVRRLEADGEEPNCLHGAYVPGVLAGTSGAFATAYREFLGHEDLEASLAHHLEGVEPLVPGLAALLRGEATPPDGERPTMDALVTAFTKLTRSLARERPTIVFVEDLQFAPEVGLALFASLARDLGDHRVLLVATFRPEIPEGWLASVRRAHHVELLDLERLDPDSLQELLWASMGTRRIDPRLEREVVRKSGGNPLFALEMLRGLRERHLLVQRRDGTWRAASEFRDVEAPRSVLEVLRTRVAQLDPADRDLLELAACSGFEFDPRLLAEAIEEQPLPVLQGMARLERRHGLVRTSGNVFVFDHHLVQEAVYADLPEPLRRGYHQALAIALERRHRVHASSVEELDARLCALLCEHYLGAVDSTPARRYLIRAVQFLVDAYVNDRALRLVDRALATEGLLEHGLRFEVLLRRLRILDRLGRREEQKAALDEAVALAAALGTPRDRARGEAERGHYHLRVGRTKEAYEHYAKQAALLREVDDPRLEAAAAGNLGNATLDLGRFEEARSHCERCVVLSRRAGETWMEAVATSNLGNAHMYLGDVDRGEAAYQRAFDTARQVGHRMSMALALGNLGFTKLLKGRLAEAHDLLPRHLELARQIADRRAETLAIGNLGRAHLAVGAHDRARALLAEYEEMAQDIGFVQGTGYAFASQAWLAEQREDFEQALERAERCLDVRRGLSIPAETCEALVTLGRVEAAVGEHEAARSHLAEAVDIAREMNDGLHRMVATTHALAYGNGEEAAARKAWGRARSTSRRPDALRAGYLLWRATRDRHVLEEARRLLEALLADAPAAFRAFMARRIPLHRAVRDA